jgi:hypothetical protein
MEYLMHYTFSSFAAILLAAGVLTGPAVQNPAVAGPGYMPNSGGPLDPGNGAPDDNIIPGLAAATPDAIRTISVNYSTSETPDDSEAGMRGLATSTSMDRLIAGEDDKKESEAEFEVSVPFFPR